MDRLARLPVVVLLAVAALGLLTGVAAVAEAVRDEGARSRVPDTVDAPAEVEAVRVLRSWDSRRARAYARGDPAALADLYVPGSRTGAADSAVLRAYRERGLRVTGMRTRLVEARVVQASGSRICLVVTDVLFDAVAVGAAGGGAWALPRDGPSTRRVVLVHDGAWRVAEVYPVT